MILLIKKRENNSQSIKPVLVMGRKPRKERDQWAKNKPYLISWFPLSSLLLFFFSAIALYRLSTPFISHQNENPCSTELHHHLLVEATVHEKKRKIMLLFLFLSILSFSSSSLFLNQEGFYLQQTKLSLSDPDSALSSWSNRDTTPCSWSGIKCDPATNSVCLLSA